MDQLEKLMQIKERIDQSEMRFREFFENAPEGITILDVNSFKFIDFNSNALKFLKYSAEELVKRGPDSISPEFQPDGLNSVEKAAKYTEQALNGEKPVFEWLCINGKGEKVFFEVRLVRVSGTNSPQLYASFVDITERKEKEEKLKCQNKKLTEIARLQSHQVRKPIAT